MNISYLALGNELIDGKITETNSIFIANQLSSIGLQIDYKLCCRDNINDIKKCLEFLNKESNIIIITGGLGPTEDDLTREVISEFYNINLIFDERIFNDIINKFCRTSKDIPEENKKQAYIPENSIIIHNRYGTAPGFIIENNNKIIVCFPGVPSELKEMFNDFLNYLKEKKIYGNFHSIYYRTIGIPESVLDTEIKLNDSDLFLGTIANHGHIDLRIDIKNKTPDEINILREMIQNKYPDIMKKVYSFDKNKSITEVIIDLMKQKDRKLYIAESCTGGLLSKLITDIAGASEIFHSSLITYSNEAKQKLLSVDSSILMRNGAVSYKTGIAMVKGLKNLFNDNKGIYISITGIAGPGGGSETKPVGTVFITLHCNNYTTTGHFLFNGDREIIRLKTAYKALEMLWEYLMYDKCFSTKYNFSLKDYKEFYE